MYIHIHMKWLDQGKIILIVIAIGGNHIIYRYRTVVNFVHNIMNM